MKINSVGQRQITIDNQITSKSGTTYSFDSNCPKNRGRWCFSEFPGSILTDTCKYCLYASKLCNYYRVEEKDENKI